MWVEVSDRLTMLCPPPPKRFIGIGSLATNFRSDSPLTCLHTHRTWFRKMVPPGIYFIWKAKLIRIPLSQLLLVLFTRRAVCSNRRHSTCSLTLSICSNRRAQRQVPRSASLPTIRRVLRRRRSSHQMCSPFLFHSCCAKPGHQP
jgi:hypothetical protein